jgi:hypothetical protein
LAEIAAKSSARLPGEGVKYLLEYDRELLIDVLLREFAKAGLGTGDEPNQRGLEIEEIIDFVASITETPDAPSG